MIKREDNTLEDNIFFDDNVKAYFIRDNNTIGYVLNDGKVVKCNHWTTTTNLRECCINTKTFSRIYDIWLTSTDKRINQLFEFIWKWSDTHKLPSGELVKRNYYSMTYLTSDLFQR